MIVIDCCRRGTITNCNGTRRSTAACKCSTCLPTTSGDRTSCSTTSECRTHPRARSLPPPPPPPRAVAADETRLSLYFSYLSHSLSLAGCTASRRRSRRPVLASTLSYTRTPTPALRACSGVPACAPVINIESAATTFVALSSANRQYNRRSAVHAVTTAVGARDVMSPDTVPPPPRPQHTRFRARRRV